MKRVMMLLLAGAVVMIFAIGCGKKQDETITEDQTTTEGSGMTSDTTMNADTTGEGSGMTSDTTMNADTTGGK